MSYLFGIFFHYHYLTITKFHGFVKTHGQSVCIFGTYGKFVHHNFNIVRLVSIHLHTLDKVNDFAIYSGIYVTFLAYLVKEFSVMSLTTLHQWSQKKNSLVVILLQNKILHIFFCIFHHFLAGVITKSFSGSRKEKTKVVVHLCHCTNGTAWILVCSLLLNANHRTQSTNFINIRT